MSEGHNDKGEERTEQEATNERLERAEPKSASYYYDDSTNYETYCEDDDDEPAPTEEAAG